MDKLFALIKSNSGSLTNLANIASYIESIFGEFEVNMTTDKGDLKNAIIDTLIQFLQSEKA